MDRKPLIGVSICAVVLLVLGSLSNVVGYQTVQSSNQQTIKETVNQKELLFQTIVDITNNKEIQRIILKSQMSSGIFPPSEFPVVTKQQLRQMYLIGLILSKVLNKSRIQSMEQYQLINPEIQPEIFTVIEKDTTIKAKITQLKDSKCDCEKDKIAERNFTVICKILDFIALCGFLYFMFLGKYVYGWAVEHNRTIITKIIYLLVWSYYFSIMPIIYLMIIFGCIEISIAI